MSSLSVVVPATDSPPTLASCLAAIAASVDQPDEVVVVGGPTTLSAAGARNAGVDRATGDVVVFVDADVEVHPDAIGRIRATFADRPDLTAVHGAYDDTPRARTTVSAFRNLLHHHVHREGAGPAQTFWTGLGAVRRSSFLGVGGFDEARYPHPSIEDIELGQRLLHAGGRLALDPAIQGTHLKRWTLRSMLWTDSAARGVPWIALQLRTRSVSSTLNCGWRHRLSALLCVAASVGPLAQAPLVALASLTGLIGLNHAFYGLLARQQGWAQAAAGVFLHGLHHLVAVAAVPVGIAVALTAGLRTPERATSSVEAASVGGSMR